MGARQAALIGWARQRGWAGRRKAPAIAEGPCWSLGCCGVFGHDEEHRRRWARLEMVAAADVDGREKRRAIRRGLGLIKISELVRI